MVCAKCGNKISGLAKVCPHCGVATDEAPTVDAFAEPNIFSAQKQSEGETRSSAYAAPRFAHVAVARRSNRILAVVLIVAAIIAAVLILKMFAGNDVGYRDKIVEPIQTTAAESNGDTTTNYMPTLTADVEWGAISEGNREGIAKYAVNKALSQAKADKVILFNIMGMTSEGIPAFIYSADTNTVHIIVDYEVTGEIEL